MKRKRFSVDQIVAVIKQAEMGVPLGELIRQVGISEQTFYRRKKQYTGVKVYQVRQLKQLQEGERAAEAAGGGSDPGQGHAPGCTRKKTLGPGRRRQGVGYLCGCYRVSERRACRVTRWARSTQRYRSVKDPQMALRLRMREIAQARVRYGYRRIRVLLNREGWEVGKKLAYRLYREEGLALRQRRPRRRRVAVQRRERCRPTAPNQVWSMDFVADQLADGRRFRALTVMDIFTRESLAIEVGQSLTGTDVVGVLNRLQRQRGVPKLLFCDNGAEFTSQVMDLWAYQNGVRIDFSRPGQPTDNAFAESFNGSLRKECLNAHWFSSLGEAQQTIEAWRQEYNESRPHRALGERSPLEFACQLTTSCDLAEVEMVGNSP